MPLKTSYQKYILNFKFDAGTSRGVLKEKETWIIKVWDTSAPEIFGFGECGPLKKLSIDDRKDLGEQIADALSRLEDRVLPSTAEEVFQVAGELAGAELPAVRFGLETALLDLLNGGRRVIFDNDFVRSELKIPINGLIWMGHMEAMLLQISNKVDAGFDCIKMKIGSLDFEKETDILDYVRRKYYQNNIMLRVDANGAFKVHEARHKLEVLSKYKLHSIEQPIAAGQPDEMARLCSNTPVDIALDEELIGIYGREAKRQLLEKIKPQYIILKPTLVGGIQSCMEWVEIAESMDIGWWLTSALESNIGLNAICQMSPYLKACGHQGLGTGQLYHNNIPSPLKIEGGHIFYDSEESWDFTNLDV
ncbi:o-succinylbenzoate synthase [Fulvivirga sp. 29W222]|uniref:O-succinylbenzoate synthase n=2 Tax=Fulvivirga marina TaxID=2494733 RepID=A0A937FWM4_9BACT|nr:o-succinylbenzoate synthase [Fulvivirga marina]MBL6445868.1 o-succinylbenzoate synthase [Fulvivirga marina]